MKQVLTVALSCLFLMATSGSFAAESSDTGGKNQNSAMGAKCKTASGEVCNAGTEGCICAE